MGDFHAELHCVFFDVHFHIDELHEKDAEKFKDYAEVMFSKVKKAVQSLHAAADKLDKVWSDCKVIRASGTSVGIFGGVMTIIGGVATVMTAGAATPLVAAGIGAGIVGAGTNVAGNIRESLINSKEIKKAESDLKEALDSIEDVKRTIHELKHKEISRLHKICMQAEAENWSKPVIKLLGGILFAAKEASKESQAFEGPAAKAGEAGVKAAGAKRVVKAGVKSTAKAGAQAAGKVGAGAADEVLKVGTKAGGKLAGGLIVGISTVFLAWDIAELGFTIRDLLEKKGSDAAKELRQKAEKLENTMKKLEEEGSI